MPAHLKRNRKWRNDSFSQTAWPITGLNKDSLGKKKRKKSKKREREKETEGRKKDNEQGKRMDKWFLKVHSTQTFSCRPFLEPAERNATSFRKCRRIFLHLQNGLDYRGQFQIKLNKAVSLKWSQLKCLFFAKSFPIERFFFSRELPSNKFKKECPWLKRLRIGPLI